MKTIDARAGAVMLVSLGLAVALMATWPAVHAQSTSKAYRVGYLSTGSRAAMTRAVDEFRNRLRELGWIEGKNFAIDYRFAENRLDLIPDLAADLVRLKVDVIVATPAAAAVAAKNATNTIPIVFALATDPVGLGLISSLARPGGNVTGVTATVGIDIAAKRLQFLKEAVPKARRVAILSNPASPTHLLVASNLKAAASSIGVALYMLEVREPEEFESAFAAMTKEGADALLVVGDPLFGTHAARIAELAARNRLPSMYGARGEFDPGGLMFYGSSGVQQLRHAAVYVDKILKGTKPADLPVEQPTKFDLVINLKVAKALGLSIPRPLLLRADELIE